MQGYSLAFTHLGRHVVNLVHWIRSVSNTQRLGSRMSMELVSTVGKELLQSDHVRLYRQVAGSFWAIAPGPSRSPDPSHPGLNPDTAYCCQTVGHGGIVGYVGLTGKDMRIADVKASVAYDENLDDVLVGHNVHCLHQAMIVRSACKDNTQAVLVKVCCNSISHSRLGIHCTLGAVLQAMRGWDKPAQEYNQDDHSLLRVMARSVAKVWLPSCNSC